MKSRPVCIVTTLTDVDLYLLTGDVLGDEYLVNIRYNLLIRVPLNIIQ